MDQFPPKDLTRIGEFFLKHGGRATADNTKQHLHLQTDVTPFAARAWATSSSRSSQLGKSDQTLQPDSRSKAWAKERCPRTARTQRTTTRTVSKLFDQISGALSVWGKNLCPAPSSIQAGRSETPDRSNEALLKGFGVPNVLWCGGDRLREGSKTAVPKNSAGL